MSNYANDYPISVSDNELPALIPKTLMDRAFSTSPTAGNVEYAWLRDDALAVISILETQGCFILGVDTWIPRPDIGPYKLTPLGYDWDPEVSIRDPRYPRSATDFVRSFAPPPSATLPQPEKPYFNLTVLRRDN